ncbi:MAG: glycosyltransferase [Acidobacteria bacterium]|nr:glycosyltransferase [Acidobacteriota bacterium]
MQPNTPGNDPIDKKCGNNIAAKRSEGKYKPYCSIIIPIYNAASTLELCLESLSRLNYPEDKIEILAVDNGSTDRSVDIARRFNITILSETTVQSPYAARNAGIRTAKGNLIAFTDSDCMVTPEWLNYLTADWENETYGCFAGEIEAYQPQSLVELFSERRGFMRQSDTLKNPYMPYPKTANAAYRKNVFDRIGLFVPEMPSGGDADIAWRMQKKLRLKVKYVPEALIYHKHRTDIQGLYNQFIKYEYGKFHLTKYYPDYPFPTIHERKEELENSILQYSIQLRKNTLSLINGSIDFVGFAAPFLEMIMCAGTLKARVEIEKSLNKSVDITLEDANYLHTEDDFKPAMKSNTMSVEEMAAVIAQKDRLISVIINSRSWKITAPFRKIAELLKS